MNISISGSGPAVVFIHGFCEDSSIWTPFQEKLEPNYRIILVDLPGHGKSPLALTKFSIDEIADLIQARLVDRGIEKYFVIGHSLGGYVSLALAENHHEQVMGFGLFSSTTFPDTEEKKKARTKVGDFLNEHGVKVFIDSFVPNLFSPKNRDKMVAEMDELKGIGSMVSSETIVAFSLAMKDRLDRTQLLTKEEFIKFIIAGEDDGAVPLDSSRKMIDKVQKENSLLLEGVGHNGFIEAQAETLEFIEMFLERNIR